ncbi:putative PadR-like family transcriptional regulator [Streptomyces graminofaciens]|jgi:DNA-binding PadR family transcriptional regulator|uniref:PadR-like family transcriptional regulator n=1 Tax=Streptomyces graminofaciens TaxID=68212 RepID=A0ABN5VUU1_9ACTN|nr:PadR family transcriptional regulator [Streptomyces graminofaciens]BBC36320.1 putative PadR-like family transcriptional regulator [Streptomyces graminofaciens]
MSTRHILLGLLAGGPSHGYDLKRRHDERFPQARPLAYGQVYTTLQRLVRDGLAEVDGTEADSGPERTMYRSTDDGSHELTKWAGEIAPPAPFVTNEIFAKVVVSILAAGDPAAYLRRQRAAHMARMRELTAVKTAPGADLATVLSADYALNHLDADLRWMNTTAGRLTTLTAEVDAA